MSNLLNNLTQSDRELQVELIRNMKKIAAPHGKVVISVFNKEKFHNWGLPVFYKGQVEPTVGRIEEEDPKVKQMLDRGILVTKKGVYSEWFNKEDLKALLEEAELEAEIFSHTGLKSRFDFSDHTDYLSEDIEKEVISRAILAIATI